MNDEATNNSKIDNTNSGTYITRRAINDELLKYLGITALLLSGELAIVYELITSPTKTKGTNETSNKTYVNKTQNGTNGTQEIEEIKKIESETPIIKKELLYVDIAGEIARKIPYENRKEVEKIAKNIWGIKPTDNFDTYFIPRGNLSLNGDFCDIFLSSDEMLLEENTMDHGKLYRIVSKKDTYDKTGKLKELTPEKMNRPFENILAEGIYAEVKRRAKLDIREEDSDNMFVPKCAAVHDTSKKVTKKFKKIDGIYYLAIGWNTGGMGGLNPLDDNSDENAELMYSGKHSGSGGGGIGASSDGPSGGHDGGRPAH